ncbi:general substrate transporter [Thelephora terrestris]|uniref:General substrate transporter n=1 Tax=Thelephora terrestris TaxID=56493 RepID=A0A9P6L684_9AGAM|nr:general substrate transporter [Thelephora terrestris]
MSHNPGAEYYTPLRTEDPERHQSHVPEEGYRVTSIPYGGSLDFTPVAAGSSSQDSYTYTYRYGPPGLAGLLRNRYTFACALFASIGGLTFGYDQGVIANVLVMKDFLERWPDVGPWEKGVMTAVLELFALAGSLVYGVLADRYSRRTTFFTACVVFCVGSALQCGARKFSDLVVGRAIGGFGVGALSMLCPLYMAEISPPEFRGALMAMEQFSIVLGCVLGFWAGFFTRGVEGSASWRIPLGAQLIPGLVLATGCVFLPPSPRLLVAQGRTDDALQTLAKLRLRSEHEVQDDPLLRIEMLEMQVEARLVRQTQNLSSSSSGTGSGIGLQLSEGEECLKSGSFNVTAEFESWARLFSKKFIDRTWIGILMMVFQQWSGINALLYYGPTLIREIGLKGDTVSLVVSGGIGIVQFIAVLPAIAYIDSVGRKALLRGGGIVMGCSHLAIASLVMFFGRDWGSHSMAAWVAVGFVYLFTASYGVSYGPIGWVLPSEVFPQSVRSKGVALSTASNWLNNFLIGLVTPALLATSPSITFLIFATACFAAYFWATYWIPETANVSLEDIDTLFGSTAGREDLRIKRQIERELGLHDLIQELVRGSSLDVDE